MLRSFRLRRLRGPVRSGGDLAGADFGRLEPWAHIWLPERGRHGTRSFSGDISETAGGSLLPAGGFSRNGTHSLRLFMLDKSLSTSSAS